MTNGPIAFKFYTEVKYLKLHKKKLSMTRLAPKLHSLMTLVSPKSLKCNISMNNGPIAQKFCMEVQSQYSSPSDQGTPWRQSKSVPT